MSLIKSTLWSRIVLKNNLSKIGFAAQVTNFLAFGVTKNLRNK